MRKKLEKSSVYTHFRSFGIDRLILAIALVLALSNSALAVWNTGDEVRFLHNKRRVKGKLVLLMKYINKKYGKALWKAEDRPACSLLSLSEDKTKPQKFMNDLPLDECSPSPCSDSSTSPLPIQKLDQLEAPAAELNSKLSKEMVNAVDHYKERLSEGFLSFKEKNLSDPEELVPCEKLEQKYEIKTGKEFTRGNHGTIAPAKMKGNSEGELVIKTIYDPSPADFVREVAVAEIFGSGNSPKISAYYLCQEGSKVFGKLLMERLDGSLTDYLKTNKLNKQQVAEITELVERFHQQKMVHLDLRTDNIGYTMINKVPKFFLLDFGLSKTFNDKNDKAFIHYQTVDQERLQETLKESMKN